MKENRQDRSEWLQELTKLKVQYNNNARKRFQTSTKSDLKEIFVELLSYEDILAKKTNKEKCILLSNISAIKKDIHEVSDSIQTTNAEILHSKLNDIDNSLKEFKLKSCEEYDKLTLEENTLSKEIRDYADHLTVITETHKQPIHSKIKKQPKEEVGILDEESKFKKDIESLTSQIDSVGGNECGWDLSDHKEFLKMAVRHKQRTHTLNFLTDLQKLVPNLTEEQIKEHSEKYDLYLKLFNERKVLMAQYKEYKGKKKIEAAKQEIEEEKAKQPKPIPSPVKIEERKAIKEKLDKWKKDKEEQISKTKEDIASEEAKKKAKEEEIKRKSQIQKQIVSQYKEKKQKAKEINQIIEVEKQKATKKELTAEEKQRLKEREQNMIQEMIKVKKDKDEKNMIKEMKQIMMLNKTKEKFNMVKPKLNQETTSLNQKKRDKFDSSKEKGRDALTFGGAVSYQPMRAVPSWRAGL